MVVNSRQTECKEVIVTTLQIGTADKMQAIVSSDRIELQFVSANRFDVQNRTLVLTKLPAQVINALTGVLNERESSRTIEFAGKNYQGRACIFVEDPHTSFALVFEFPSPNSIGYLLHMTKDEVQDFRAKLRALPASPYPTD